MLVLPLKWSLIMHLNSRASIGYLSFGMPLWLAASQSPCILIRIWLNAIVVLSRLLWTLFIWLGAPLTYLCFALEYVSFVQQHLARHSLDWRSPYDHHWGDTPDISVFRFPFWSEVWYYSPTNQFPQFKMLPGWFLGIAQNVGDALCCLVLTKPMDASTAPQVIACSVISQCSSASV